jgi:hypothetical protein
MEKMNNVQFLYINGDSWLSHFVDRVIHTHPLFNNIFVINQSVPGCGNMSIINRTCSALANLKKYNIKPWVLVGLSEVGRDSEDEFKLVRPIENLTEYLKSISLAQFNILKTELAEYQHYICSAWTFNPVETKSIIDFIDEDFSNIKPVYAVSNGIYSWINDRKHILKINKSSFVEAVENKQIFESLLLSNPYIDQTLHLDKSTDLIFERFFNHVLSTFKACDDKL